MVVEMLLFFKTTHHTQLQLKTSRHNGIKPLPNASALM